MLIRVFSQFRFRCSNLRQVVSVFVSKSCWYARVWLVRGHAVLIKVFFSQFRFQWSKSVVEPQVFCKIRLYTNVWLFRDYPMFIGVFPSFTFSGPNRSWVFCKVCFTYTYVWLFRGYSTLIRGFSQFRFQWSRPFIGSFARHADKHISDYLGTIQWCW